MVLLCRDESSCDGNRGSTRHRELEPFAQKALRMANEIPSLVTIVVVILVIVKPF